MPNAFIPQLGHYEELIAYKKAECIYDVTYFFVNHYLSRGDRTVDQMLQAARSGKQNIVEGSAAATASRETEIKLYNVAKASLQELLADYADYLRVRNLELWHKESPKAVQTRRVCREHPDSAFYRERMEGRSPGAIANIAIVLIHQADYLLARLIDAAKKRFLEEGGDKGTDDPGPTGIQEGKEGVRRAGSSGRTESSGSSGRPDGGALSSETINYCHESRNFIIYQ